MRKTLLLALMFISASFVPATAQPSLVKVVESLEQAEVFVKYRKFKREFEQMNREVAPTLTNYAEYDKLKLAYDQVEKKYNSFLEGIKRDLSDYSVIRQMVRDPLTFANRYGEDYREVIFEYEKNYLPVYNKLSVGKAIPPALVAIGIDLLKEVVEIIVQRPELKEEKFNVILSVINSFFYDKLKMKSWSEMGFKAPANTPSTQGSTTQASQATTEPVDVQAPVFGEMAGWVEFVSLNASNQEVAMRFGAPVSKAITVETRRTEEGEVVTQQQTARVAQFESIDTYKDGSQFLIRVNNTAGMYVLALNSDNDVVFLYPYENEDLGGCRDFAPVSKDINLGYLNSTPAVGKDENGVTTLPTPDCRYNPPRDRYFTISGDSRKEEFAILLTRSEMDIREVETKLEQARGTLAERLGQVFAGSAVSSTGAVSVSGNRMQFDAGSSQQTVLPVVFNIYR